MMTLADVKQHLRISGNDEDAITQLYLDGAYEWAEGWTGTALVRREFQQVFSAFDTPLALEWGPDAADAVIAFTDASGASSVVNGAILADGFLYPPSSGWPAIQDYSLITVTYTAGFTEVPDDMNIAILLHVRANYDEWRTGEYQRGTWDAIHAHCKRYRPLAI